MKKQVLWKDYLNSENKIAINCKTESEAEQLLQMLHDKGFEWCSGDSLKKHKNWCWYTKNTCYAVDEIGVSYCNKHWYIEKDYTVYSFSEIELVGDITQPITPRTIAENAINIMVEKSDLFDLDTEYNVIMDALAKLLQYEDKERVIPKKYSNHIMNKFTEVR